MMTERKITDKLGKHVCKKFDNVFWYKIPDLPQSKQTRKPFDVFGIINGIPFAIEFKMEKGIVLEHQLDSLKEVYAAGGEAHVIRLTKDMEINYQMIEQFIRQVISSKHINRYKI